MLKTLIDFVLHLDTHLAAIIAQYGPWTYGLLFMIIFCETGLVVMPFLPGDSLLFAAGAMAGMGRSTAPALPAPVGRRDRRDNMNYWIGRRPGPKIFVGERRWLNRNHLDRTHRFFEKYGHEAIILARFVPIVRTFTPFVAGVGRMSYRRFFFFDILGGVIWISAFVLGGYFFGNLPVVKHHFHLVIVAIIVVSLMPPVIEYLRHRKAKPTV